MSLKISISDLLPPPPHVFVPVLSSLSRHKFLTHFYSLYPLPHRVFNYEERTRLSCGVMIWLLPLLLPPFPHLPVLFPALALPIFFLFLRVFSFHLCPCLVFFSFELVRVFKEASRNLKCVLSLKIGCKKCKTICALNRKCCLI
jgi:hypothetical protein